MPPIAILRFDDFTPAIPAIKPTRFIGKHKVGKLESRQDQ